MVTVLPIASGKGGVGKSVISANLGIALSQLGKTVILVDLDLGGSNLHTFLGIMNSTAGIGALIHNRTVSFEGLIQTTPFPRLFFIPGDNLYSGTANLPYFIKKKILREINKLTADYVILDLGAGSAYNTIDFFLASWNGLLVSSGEITSVLNAYSFLKTGIFRLFTRSFPKKSREREIIRQFLIKKIEGTELSFRDLFDGLSQENPEAGEKLKGHLQKFYPRVVINMNRSPQDVGIGARLRQISRQNLSLEMEYISCIPWDDSIRESILQRTPAVILSPSSEFSNSIKAMATKLVQSPVSAPPRLFESNEDLMALIGKSQREG